MTHITDTITNRWKYVTRPLFGIAGERAAYDPYGATFKTSGGSFS